MKNVKRYIGMLLTCALCLCFVSCGDGAPSGMDKVIKLPQYAENTVDYTLFVPESWTITMANGAVAAVCSKDDPASVSMTSYSLSGSTSVASEWDKLRKQTEAIASSFEMISEPDYENEKSGVAAVGGVKAGLYEYKAVISGSECHYLQALFVRGGVLYVFTYCAQESSFSLHRAEAEAMLGELSFEKEAPCPAGMKAAVTAESKYILSDKYELFVDENWTVDASSGILTARFASLATTVTIQTASVDSTVTTEDYIAGAKTALESSLPSYQLISESGDKMLVGTAGTNYKATELEYSAIMDGTTYRFCQVLCRCGTDMHILTFSTTEGYYDTHITYFIKLLDAFRIIEA